MDLILLRFIRYVKRKPAGSSARNLTHFLFGKLGKLFLQGLVFGNVGKVKIDIALDVAGIENLLSVRREARMR